MRCRAGGVAALRGEAGNAWTEGIDDDGAEAAGLAGCCAALVRSREAMSGIILAADSVMTSLLQHGNQSLSLSCTPSQPSTHSGWLTVVYLTDT